MKKKLKQKIIGLILSEVAYPYTVCLESLIDLFNLIELFYFQGRLPHLLDSQPQGEAGLDNDNITITTTVLGQSFMTKQFIEMNHK